MAKALIMHNMLGFLKRHTRIHSIQRVQTAWFRQLIVPCPYNLQNWYFSKKKRIEKRIAYSNEKNIVPKDSDSSKFSYGYQDFFSRGQLPDSFASIAHPSIRSNRFCFQNVFLFSFYKKKKKNLVLKTLIIAFS